MLAHALDINSQGFMLSDFMTFRRSFVDRNKQVLNFFIVNLHHGDIDFVLLIAVWFASYPVENLLAGNGYDSLNVKIDTLFAP